MKQAQSASRAAETLMKGDGDSELQEKLTQKEAGKTKITFIESILKSNCTLSTTTNFYVLMSKPLQN